MTELEMKLRKRIETIEVEIKELKEKFNNDEISQDEFLSLLNVKVLLQWELNLLL